MRLCNGMSRARSHGISHAGPKPGKIMRVASGRASGRKNLAPNKNERDQGRTLLRRITSGGGQANLG